MTDVEEIAERIMEAIMAPADLAPEIRRALTTTLRRYGERVREEALEEAVSHLENEAHEYRLVGGERVAQALEESAAVLDILASQPEREKP